MVTKKQIYLNLIVLFILLLVQKNEPRKARRQARYKPAFNIMQVRLASDKQSSNITCF